MKTPYYIVALICFVLISSCKKDFLQRDPGVPIDYEKLFSDAQLAAGFADNTYNFLLDDYARLSTANGMTSQFSDESISNTGDPVVNLINTGRHLNPGATDVAAVYSQMYKGIRNANVMLANIDRVPWTTLYNPTYIRGEQLFLRAFLYFELNREMNYLVPLTLKPLLL
jgi:starch-binding outer membrane protein, SusD/RagB family